MKILYRESKEGVFAEREESGGKRKINTRKRSRRTKRDILRTSETKKPAKWERSFAKVMTKKNDTY